ncbi:MAG: hypothetical protein AAF668_03350 [Pseudomonadota bacterium]
MKWTTEELVDLLKRTLGGQNIGDDWDDLARCAIKDRDQFTVIWGRKITSVEELFPRRHPTELFNVELGTPYLKEILVELRSMKTTPE